MLNKEIIRYLSGFLAWAFSAGIALSLSICVQWLGGGDLRLDLPETYLRYFLFSLLIAIGYALIFGLMRRKQGFPLPAKALVNGLAGSLLIYLFSFVGGGRLSFARTQDLIFFGIFSFISFAFPFIYAAVRAGSNISR